jgi:hypothetical protein
VGTNFTVKARGVIQNSGYIQRTITGPDSYSDRRHEAVTEVGRSLEQDDRLD